LSSYDETEHDKESKVKKPKDEPKLKKPEGARESIPKDLTTSRHARVPVKVIRRKTISKARKRRHHLTKSRQRKTKTKR
jgi:hypothetical protein